jgi:hypothetical protein
MMLPCIPLSFLTWISSSYDIYGITRESLSLSARCVTRWCGTWTTFLLLCTLLSRIPQDCCFYSIQVRMPQWMRFFLFQSGIRGNFASSSRSWEGKMYHKIVRQRWLKWWWWSSLCVIDITRMESQVLLQYLEAQDVSVWLSRLKWRKLWISHLLCLFLIHTFLTLPILLEWKGFEAETEIGVSEAKSWTIQS